MFILLVEDDPFYANLIRMFLEQNGYTDIKHVDNALECLQQVREDRVPDLIILDYFLGTMDGLSVDNPGELSNRNLDGLSTLKQIKAYKPELKVILLSGQKDVKIAVQSIKKGAYEYVVKKGGEELARVLSIIKEIETKTGQKKTRKPVANFLTKVKSFLIDND
jgi:DNA-binding NtrC family response regulator